MLNSSVPPASNAARPSVSAASPIIFIIDDEIAIREALRELVERAAAASARCWPGQILGPRTDPGPRQITAVPPTESSQLI